MTLGSSLVLFAVDIGLYSYVVHHNTHEKHFYQRMSYSFWKIEDDRILSVSFHGKPLTLGGVLGSDEYDGGKYIIVDKQHRTWNVKLNSKGKVVQASLVKRSATPDQQQANANTVE